MNYVKHAACNGAPPHHLSNISCFNRNALLALMMRKREAIRYLVAPFGFGKTYLAYSYARMVNEFESSYWFDGNNPCFLRDLDAHTLLVDLLAETPPGALIVFDDIPFLGPSRKEYLWDVMNGLVEEGREVVACAAPGSNPLQGHEADCVCVGAKDLLYSEKDADFLQDVGLTLRFDDDVTFPALRIPFLITQVQDHYREFLQMHIDDIDDPRQTALSFALLVIEQGTIEDLELVLKRKLNTQDISTSFLRPFVRFDEYSEDFFALGFPLSAVLRAFDPYIGTFAEEFGAGGASEIALQIADVLFGREKYERATQLLMGMCEPLQRCTWLTKRQDELLHAGALVPAQLLFESLRSKRWRSIPELYTASCIRLCLMDCSEDARENLSNIVARTDFPLKQRLEALSVAYLMSEDVQKAHIIEELFQAHMLACKQEAQQLEGAHKALWLFWSKATTGRSKLSTLSAKIEREACSALAFALCVRKARIEEYAANDLQVLQERVQDLLGAEYMGNAAYCALLCREIDAAGFEIDQSNFSAHSTYRRCELFEDNLEVQRTSYLRSKAALYGALSSGIKARTTRMHLHIQEQHTSIPLLRTHLFGRFDVQLGGRQIDLKVFKRQKVRTLLALLILDCGHDLSCDNLAARLWPDSSPVQARHNFHNAVSLLRRGLALEDGSCPYFHRPYGVLGMEQGLTESDVSVMKELCTRLRFAEPEVNLYYSMLEQIRDTYGGDLMPSEQNEPMILAAREEWRNRIVNTLLHAGRRLASTGEAQVSVQLVEQALSYNPAREDVYEQLMSMQARCGQRPAAIETWMKYRSFLYEELGLDPSPRISSIYERIVREEF